ncbi:MAG: hypothetical protein JAY90_21740 [Candidatus Thiodiazotropha lotti]|nr:hypothetical protein [Candidatus Thiodiazotropha lotti]
MSGDQHPRPQNQWELAYQLFIRLFSHATPRELRICILSLIFGFLLAGYFPELQLRGTTDENIQSLIEDQKKINALILQRHNSTNQQLSMSIAELTQKVEHDLTEIHDIIGRSLSELIESSRGERSTIPKITYTTGQLPPSLRSQALRDLRDLEVHIETFGSINLNGYTAPEVMLIRIRVILRYLGIVESLEASRDQTRSLVRNLQQKANDVGYIALHREHLGFFGKKTIALFRRLIMTNTSLACGKGSDECLGMLHIN